MAINQQTGGIMFDFGLDIPPGSSAQWNLYSGTPGNQPRCMLRVSRARRSTKCASGIAGKGREGQREREREKDKITAAACIMIYLRALRCAAEEIYSRGNARKCGRGSRYRLARTQPVLDVSTRKRSTARARAEYVHEGRS